MEFDLTQEEAEVLRSGFSGLDAAKNAEIPPSEWRMPAPGEVPGLDDVLRAAPADADPAEILGFLHTRQPELEIRGKYVTPLDWLRAGRSPRTVVRLIRHITEPVQ